MHLTTFDFMMFVHVMAAVIGIGMAFVLHAALMQMRKADTVDQLRPWMGVIRVLEPLLPLAALVLFGTGWWMLHLSDGEFSWGQGWVITSVVALVVVEVLGALVAPRSKAMQKVVKEAPQGPRPASVPRTDPVFWYMAHFGTVVFFGVIFLMSVKPSGPWSVVVMVVAGVLGLASASPFLRERTVVSSTAAGREAASPVGAGVPGGPATG